MDRNIPSANLETVDISPVLLIAGYYNSGRNPAGFPPHERLVYDYELEYHGMGGGRTWINGRAGDLVPGTVLFRRPGDTARTQAPFECYTLIFDMAGDRSKRESSYDPHANQVLQERHRNPILDVIPSRLVVADRDAARTLFETVFHNYATPSLVSPLLIRSAILELLSLLHKDACRKQGESQDVYDPHHMRLQRAIQFIEDNYSEKIGLASIAAAAGLSPNYFHKIFRSSMEVTLNDYLVDLRLSKAKELLLTTQLPISEVAIRCGFENIPYFSKVFHDHVGMTPVQYRRVHVFHNGTGFSRG